MLNNFNIIKSNWIFNFCIFLDYERRDECIHFIMMCVCVLIKIQESKNISSFNLDILPFY